MNVIQELCDRTVIINDGRVIVDDKVENLMKLFEVRAYSITIGDALSEHQQKLLQQKFPDYNYVADSHASLLSKFI